MEEKTGRGGRERGQMIVGVILLLVLMAIFVPVMVTYTQREAKWSVKQDQTNTAFHLAEAGVEKAYRKLSLSTGTWYSVIESGTPITNFKFDKSYDDVPGGVYSVSITSGPKERQATVISIGREAKKKEIRSIEAIFSQNILGDIAIQAMDGVSVAGGVQVEWGSVIGAKPIDASDRSYPQFHSAASIIGKDADPAPPNCDSPDCCQWFAYSQDIPPDPGLDLGFYRTSATATTTYYDTAQSWDNYSYTGGGTVMIENNLTLGSPGVDIVGNLIVTGNLTTTSGGWGKGSVDMAMPTGAWKQYCGNWSHYSVFGDSTAPAAFPGLDSTYLSPALQTYNPTGNKCAVQGFLYVGGNFTTSGGGGSTEVYGTMFAVGTVSVAANSAVTLYYNKSAAEGVKTTRLVLKRSSWKAVLRNYPL